MWGRRGRETGEGPGRIRRVEIGDGVEGLSLQKKYESLQKVQTWDGGVRGFGEPG